MSVRMVQRSAPVGLCLFLLAGAVAPAHAFSTYPTRIPNGRVNNCLNCHLTAQGGTARNSFGNDTRATRTGALPNWPALHSLDSDGDGFTNGEELGDPCGVWRTGTQPMFTAVTLPADANSFPAEHTNQNCGTASSGTGSSSGSGGESGATSSDSASSTSGGGGTTGGDTGGSSGSSGDGGMGCTACDASGGGASALVVFGALVLVLRRRRS